MYFWYFWGFAAVNKAPIFDEKDLYNLGKYLRDYDVDFEESKRRVDSGENFIRKPNVKRDVLAAYCGVRFGLRRSDLAKLNLGNFEFEKEGPYQRWTGDCYCRLGERKHESL